MAAARVAELAETIRNTLLTLLALSLFCWVSLGASDTHLIITEPTISLPFADVPVTFSAFIVVAPFLLSVISIYLHVFIHELDRYSEENPDVAPPPALFNINSFVAMSLTHFIYYWLVPCTMFAITYKSIALPDYARFLLPVTCLIALATGSSGLCRWLRRSSRDPRFIVASYAFFSVVVMASITTLCVTWPALEPVAEWRRS